MMMGIDARFKKDSTAVVPKDFAGEDVHRRARHPWRCFWLHLGHDWDERHPYYSRIWPDKVEYRIDTCTRCGQTRVLDTH